MGVKVKQRGKNWWLFVHHKGRRVAKSIGTKAAAEKARILLEAQLALGDLSGLERPKPERTVPTFAEVARAWPEWYQSLYPTRASTAQGRASFTKTHLVPWFGPRLITDVTRTEVQNFIAAKRAASLKDSAIKVGLSTLNLILAYAVEMGHIAANPMRGGARLWKPQASEQPDPFTRSELSALLLAADVINPRWGLMLAVWGATGMRSGELRGLDGEDLVDGVLVVRRTYTKRVTGPPKTDRGMRSVPVPSALLAQVTEAAPVDPGAPLFPGLVRTGRMEEAELYRLWNRTVKTAGVRYRPVETMRHTAISIRLSDGEPLLRVAQESGHSAGVMLKSYAKWLDPSATIRNPRATAAGQLPRMTELENFRSKLNVPLGIEAQGFCVVRDRQGPAGAR